MAKGISLHIGLNRVDPAHYGGWDGALAACEFDAQDMAAIARKRGFGGNTLLLTQQATVAAVSQAIQNAAKQLTKGDIFFLSYSGHGGQVPDTNGDEADRMDETWVLYDRQFVDDELYKLYSGFKSGVRILVLSDSCHSGTVTRAIPPWVRGGTAVRVMPAEIGAKTYRKNKATYDKIQKENKGAEAIAPKATVLLISGCQDNQTSLDGSRNGLFTGTLKKVWNNGKFAFGYRRFRDTIVTRMPATQTPNYYVIGAANAAFEGQKPFTV
jgi:metacaspase-1